MVHVRRIRALASRRRATFEFPVAGIVRKGSGRKRSLSEI